MNNYDEKIMMIKKNQKDLLLMVKNKIQEENDIFNLDTKNIVDVLKHDNNTIKKYEAVIEAQKLIEKYTIDIKNATSIDEIKEIRKNINKCINKIKKEMINRGFDEIELNNYIDEVKKYRKVISQNIRFLKREDKISEIESLYNNIDNLNEEDLLRLKKLVKNELSYGKKHLNIEEKKDNVIVTPVEEVVEPIIENIDNNEIVETTANNNEAGYEQIVLPTVTKNSTACLLNEFDNLNDFLERNVEVFGKRYNVQEIDSYDGNLIHNIKVFTKNLPKLNINRKIVKYMMRDYLVFSRKPELLGYSKYIIANNSILSNLKNAMKGNVLKNKEKEYEDEHKKAVEWIIEYCKNNDIEIKFNKRLSA